jgi:hypothetical protein
MRYTDSSLNLAFRQIAKYTAFVAVAFGLLSASPQRLHALTYQFGPYSATFLENDPDTYVLWQLQIAGNGTAMGFVPYFQQPIFFSSSGIGVNRSLGSLLVDETARKVYWEGTVTGGTGQPTDVGIAISGSVGMAATAKFEIFGPADDHSYYVDIDGMGSGDAYADGGWGTSTTAENSSGTVTTAFGAFKTFYGSQGQGTYSGDVSRPGVFDPHAYEEVPWSQAVIMETPPGASYARGELIVPLDGSAAFQCNAPLGSYGISGGSSFTVSIWITNITRLTE